MKRIRISMKTEEKPEKSSLDKLHKRCVVGVTVCIYLVSSLILPFEFLSYRYFFHTIFLTWLLTLPLTFIIYGWSAAKTPEILDQNQQNLKNSLVNSVIGYALYAASIFLGFKFIYMALFLKWFENYIQIGFLALILPLLVAYLAGKGCSKLYLGTRSLLKADQPVDRTHIRKQAISLLVILGLISIPLGFVLLLTERQFQEIFERFPEMPRYYRLVSGSNDRDLGDFKTQFGILCILISAISFVSLIIYLKKTRVLMAAILMLVILMPYYKFALYWWGNATVRVALDSTVNTKRYLKPIINHDNK